MSLATQPLPSQPQQTVGSEWVIPEQQVDAQDLRRGFDALMRKLGTWSRLLVYYRNKPAAVLVRREDWDRLAARVEFLEAELEKRMLSEQFADRARASETDPSRRRTEGEFWDAFERIMK